MSVFLTVQKDTILITEGKKLSINDYKILQKSQSIIPCHPQQKSSYFFLQKIDKEGYIMKH